MSTEKMTVTRAQMEQAFDAWERDVRLEPENYRTEAETKCLSVSQVSAERADHFWGLIKLGRAK